MKTNRSIRFLAIVTFVVAGVAIRLYLGRTVPGNYDQQSFEIVAQIVRRGGNVYAETGRYNYSPVWAYCLWLLSYVADFSGLGLSIVIRSFLTLIDCIVALLIGLVASRVRPGWGLRSSLIYFLNPVSVLLTGGHGQFEALAALPLLAGIWLSTASPRHANSLRYWILGTCSILIKQLYAPFVWLFFVYVTTRRRAVQWGSTAGLVFLLSLVPFVPTGTGGILTNVLLYTSLQQGYGLSVFLPPAIYFTLFLFGILVLPLVAQQKLRLPIVKALTLDSVLFLALAPGIGEQYFVLPIIFGAFCLSGWYWLYTLVVTLFLLISPHNLHLIPIPPIWNVVWIVNVLWLLSYFLPENWANRGVLRGASGT